MTNKRSPYDFYATPKPTIDAMLDQFDFTYVRSFLEPSAGDGAIIKELNARYPNTPILSIELDSAHYEELKAISNNDVLLQDFLTTSPEVLQCYQMIIGNPPFSLAQEFLEHILSNIKLEEQGVIMLLRLGFLGSQKRHEFWQKYPPCKILPLSKRPSFTGHGTDSQEYAWFCWGHLPLIYQKDKRTIQVI